MKKIAVFFCLLAAALLLLLAGCKDNKINHRLSDLGGVYAADEKDIDFSVEVSGKLSEGENAQSSIKNTDNPITETSSDNRYSNKLLMWGISRKPDHQTPDADPGAPELLKKYGGIYLGDPSEKKIYLTFDEGYENGYTGKILDTLRDNSVKAVFFITGPYLKEHQDLVQRMVEEGHEVGNHTIHHPSLPSLGDDELEEEVLGLDRAFYEKFGRHMKYLRPPKGEYSERTLAITRNLGYTNVFWSFAYDDWYRDRHRGADYAYNVVERNLHNGAVLLLHAVSKDNAEALDRIIKGAREKGYEIGNINDIGQ
ncbi:MAG: delta-lactam-biosynthetic de-N-acetylase [Clostridiales bacterium]|jgi:peptidoglycan-N-acetylmuramic acid deacetylase|nr:delta-lactam-biosynthetic de-N-acetylase [Eubacteriales bacterium]MDH7565339.1 delta-lactam-biosynthetic de-N-acetylase [Clostridiales bacterium]